MLSKKSFEINPGTKKLNRKLQSTRKGTSPDQTVQGILNCPWVSPQMGSLTSQSLAPSHFSDLWPMLGLAPLSQRPGSRKWISSIRAASDNSNFVAGETASWAACFCSFPICSSRLPAGRSVLFVPAWNHWASWVWARPLELCPELGPPLGSLPGNCQVSGLGLCPFSRLTVLDLGRWEKHSSLSFSYIYQNASFLVTGRL